MRKSTATLAALMMLATPAWAQMPPVTPAPAPTEPDAIALYAGMGSSATENWARYNDDYVVRNVTRPTLTPVLPDPAKATGAAVVVAPGGAFMMLAMNHEGWKVAHWLADHGIAAFVLKYRVLPTPADENEAGGLMMKRMMDGIKDPSAPPTLTDPDATTDALAALKMVRAQAGKWNIDPERVGMIGFSAGAMTSLNAAIAPDAAARPAYFGYIYGPQAPVAVPAAAPPMFAAIAWDDELFPSRGFAIEEGWKKAGRPVELHVYQQGHHGFGMGVPGTTTTGVLDQFYAWLNMNGWLKKR